MYAVKIQHTEPTALQVAKYEMEQASAVVEQMQTACQQTLLIDNAAYGKALVAHEAAFHKYMKLWKANRTVITSRKPTSTGERP